MLGYEDPRRVSSTASSESAAYHDIEQFQATLKALDIVCSSESQKEDVLSAVAGILHLGNSEVTRNVKDPNEAKSVLRTPSFEAACSLLGTLPEDLEYALCFRTISATAEDYYEINVTYREALYTRDALSKVRILRLLLSHVARHAVADL